MPLSSVIGASSILKPGVCTSTSRPAAPYEGQTIYETDTDLMKTWDGSTWELIGPSPASTQGLTLITSKTSFSSVASVSLAQDTFTDTYDNYKIIFSISSTASFATITARYRAAGADASTGPYYWAYTQSRFNATSSVYGGNNTTSIELGKATGNIFDMTIDVIGPKLAKRTKTIFSGVSWDPTPTYTGSNFGMGYRDVDTAYDSMTFLGSANITGSYCVYGYNQ